MTKDTIHIEILADGTVKFTTPKISGANHTSADNFLRQTAQALGGDTEITRRAGAAHDHLHDHGHDHDHDHHSH